MNNLRVIQGKNIDLITPFPLQEVPRIYGWIRSFKSIVEFDGWLHGRREFKEFYTHQVIPNTPTYGIIDKHNKAVADVGVPLVGFIMAESAIPANVYINFASNMKAFNADLMSEALGVALKDLQELYPDAARFSCWLLDKNRPAYKFLIQQGFTKDAKMQSMVTQNGTPKSLIHMGYVTKT